MASVIEDVVESKKELTHTENLDMETARAKGDLAIGIAKLQPIVKLLIAYAKICAYYTLIPFIVGKLTLDVIVLGLQVTKMYLKFVKANAHIFVQLFHQIVKLLSPDFIQKFLQPFVEIFTSLADSMKGLNRRTDSEFHNIEPSFEAAVQRLRSEETSETDEILQFSDVEHEDPEPTNEAAAPQKPTVNGETPKKSDKKEK